MNSNIRVPSVQPDPAIVEIFTDAEEGAIRGRAILDAILATLLMPDDARPDCNVLLQMLDEQQKKIDAAYDIMPSAIDLAEWKAAARAEGLARRAAIEAAMVPVHRAVSKAGDRVARAQSKKPPKVSK
jgi:hypothetical protein